MGRYRWGRAKYWQQVLTEIKDRGANDVCIVVSDGLTGLGESITATWPQAIHQATTEAAARQRFTDFEEKWGRDYPAITTAMGVRVGGVRAVPAVRPRDPGRPSTGPLPHGAQPDPTGTGRQRSTNRWKKPLNALAGAFEGRILNSSNRNHDYGQLHRNSDSRASALGRWRQGGVLAGFAPTWRRWSAAGPVSPLAGQGSFAAESPAPCVACRASHSSPLSILLSPTADWARNRTP